MVPCTVFDPSRPWRVPTLRVYHLSVPVDLLIAQLPACGRVQASVGSLLALPDSWTVKDHHAVIVQLLLLMLDPAQAALMIQRLIVFALLTR